MDVVLRGTIRDGTSLIPVSKRVALPAVPRVGDKVRLVPGYSDDGVADVTGIYWHTDGTVEVHLAEVTAVPGLSSSILAGQGWDLRG